jgi:hypothetical protein
MSERTFKTDFISFETFHSLFKKTFSSGRDARYVILFPFDGGIDVLKDFFYRVCDFFSDTVAWDQCYCVYTAVLGGHLLGGAEGCWEIGEWKGLRNRTRLETLGKPAASVVADRNDGCKRKEKKSHLNIVGRKVFISTNLSNRSQQSRA